MSVSKKNDSSNEFIMIPNWYLVYTKPKSEKMVSNFFNELDIEVYYPKVKETKKVRGLVKQIVKPMFPSYLFAKFIINEKYYKAKYTWGVKKFISFGDYPTPINSQTIQFLKDNEGEEGAVLINNEFQKGDNVIVKSGSFKGLEGVVYEKNSRERVKILLNFMNNQAKFSFNVYDLGLQKSSG